MSEESISFPSSNLGMPLSAKLQLRDASSIESIQYASTLAKRELRAQVRSQACERGEPRKVAIATAIWQNTTMNMQWIAGCHSIRSAANASQHIRRLRIAPQPLTKKLKT